MKQETHIIYGYRERAGKNRWYVGCTLVRCEEERDKYHRRAEGGCTKFHNFINKAKRLGKSFDDVLEKFELETFFGTAQEAEMREKKYTALYNALAPHGFVLMAGRYNGTMSEESKKKISEKHKQRWTCENERKAQANRCSGWKHNNESKKKIGEAASKRYHNPEYVLEYNKRVEIRRAKRELLKSFQEAKQKSKSPIIEGTRLAELVVIRANRVMTEKEVVLEMKKLGWKHNRAITPLQRACGIEPSENKPHGRVSYDRLERLVTIKPSGRKTSTYRARPEFTSWMIPE